MCLNNQLVTEESKKEIKLFLETHDNEHTTQNLCYASKAVLRGKFIAIQSYLKKQEKHQIGNLTFYLKQLEKEQQQQKTKISTRKEIIKIQEEINLKEGKEAIVKINKTKIWVEKVNIIDKLLARLIKKKKEKNQQN